MGDGFGPAAGPGKAPDPTRIRGLPAYGVFPGCLVLNSLEVFSFEIIAFNRNVRLICFQSCFLKQQVVESF